MSNLTLKLAGAVLAAVGMSVLAGCAVADSVPTTDRALAQRAHVSLIDVLERDEKFIKVHAAEILNWRGEKERVRPIFERELEHNRTVPGYRVGIWRVLAGAARNRQERAEWIARIEAAFMDVTAADRIGAVESLGKVGHRVDGEVRRAAQTMAESSSASDGMFAWWALHLAGDARALGKFVSGLSSPEPVARLRAAYVIAWEQIRDPTALAALARAASTEPRDAVGYAIIVSAAVALDADPSKSAQWRVALDDILINGLPGDRYQTCLLVSKKFSAADLARLTPLLDHANGDVRVGAATAILAVLERTQK